MKTNEFNNVLKQIDNAKAAVVANYGLTATEVKEWRVQSC